MDLRAMDHLLRCLGRFSVIQVKSSPAGHAPWTSVMVARVDNLQGIFGVCRVICFDLPAPIMHGFPFYLNQTQYIRLSSSREAQQGPYQSISSPVFVALPSPNPPFLPENFKGEANMETNPSQANQSDKVTQANPSKQPHSCLFA